MILLLTSFIAGLLTVLAPCVLPLLPVIVGGSINGEQKRSRAFVVTASLAVSVVLFTLLLKASTLFITIPDYVWTWISGGIIIGFGVITLFPTLWEKISFAAKLNRSSNKILGQGFQKQSFKGDILVGAALGPVFSTCSPTYFLILATVLPQQPLVGFIYLLAYAVGLSIALLGIAFLGQKVVDKLGVAADPKGTFKKVLGIIFILVGIAILTGADKKIQTYILDAGFFDVTKIEGKLLGSDSAVSPSDASYGTTNTTSFLTAEQKATMFTLAPELIKPSGYINTEGKPITLAELKGKKVVLLDVWTYSCINCQRTVPYINEWYKKYKDQGLEIVGLHTPEFAFEKVQKNVQTAVTDFGIQYPVVLDNDFATWNAYGNKYWPRKYLIDIDGYVVYDHIGEGSYEETERAIQHALRERNNKLNITTEIDSSITKIENIGRKNTQKLTPETYFGALRNANFGNGQMQAIGTQVFTLPVILKPDTYYLDGSWTINPEYSSAQPKASITIKYKAQDVFMVASSLKGAKVNVYLDGKLVAEGAGADVINGTATIKDNKLYKIMQAKEYGEHTLKIEIIEGILEAYTFTFG